MLLGSTSVYKESSLSKRKKKEKKKVIIKEKEKKRKSRSLQLSVNEKIQPSSDSVDNFLNAVEESLNAIVVSQPRSPQSNYPNDSN